VAQSSSRNPGPARRMGVPHQGDVGAGAQRRPGRDVVGAGGDGRGRAKSGAGRARRIRCMGVLRLDNTPSGS
jgi:hypothetical protein